MPPVMKRPHEIAVDEFEDADKRYRELEDRVVSGEFLSFLLSDLITSNAPVTAAALDRIKEQWVILWYQLKNALDERNTKFTEAQTQMRAVLAPDLSKPLKWRMDGKADRIAYGKLEANTRTKRFFNGEALEERAKAKGILDQLEQLTYLDEKTGERRPAFARVIDVRFKPVMDWLRDNQYDDVINQSYDETEETPMVQGDKRIAFLGQKVDK